MNATIEKVPFFNAPVYLKNITQIGKVDEILGAIQSYVVSVQLSDNYKASSFEKDQPLYIDPRKLLPLERFLPREPVPKEARKKRKSGDGNSDGNSFKRFKDDRGGGSFGKWAALSLFDNVRRKSEAYPNLSHSQSFQAEEGVEATSPVGEAETSPADGVVDSTEIRTVVRLVSGAAIVAGAVAARLVDEALDEARVVSRHKQLALKLDRYGISLDVPDFQTFRLPCDHSIIDSIPVALCVGRSLSLSS